MGESADPGFRLRAIAFVIAATLLCALTLGVTARASASGEGNQSAQATELVRLLNGERAYHGLAPLSVDPFLTSKATDGDVACPNDPTLIAQGRAKDLALNGFVGDYPHQLRLCPEYSVASPLWDWGYHGRIGEIYAWNFSSDTAEPDPSTTYNYRFPYHYGCGDGVWDWIDACPGALTRSYYTAEKAAAGFMSSEHHREIVLGDFDRIGCGGWSAPDSSRHFVCILADSGPNEIVAPPPEVPLPAPTATPTPDPTAPAILDTTRPTVKTRSPGPTALRVWNGASVTVAFSERIRGASATTARLTNLRTGHQISVRVTYNATKRTLTIDPRSRMLGRTGYRVSLSSGLTDLAGNHLRAMSWTFRTR